MMFGFTHVLVMLAYVGTVSKLAANDQGLAQVWNLKFVCPQPLMIEIILMNLKTKVESCLSCPDPSPDLQNCPLYFLPTTLEPNPLLGARASVHNFKKHLLNNRSNYLSEILSLAQQLICLFFGHFYQLQGVKFCFGS